MIKRNLIITVLIFSGLIPVAAQEKKEESKLKREVTLYNPYKPSLPESKKKSYLPDMNDTIKVRPDFRYTTTTKPFLPAYTVSPIKAASLLPDPLTKLYKSYVNIGLGNYTTPLAEISITNERSKKGTIGFYARHFSSNGNIELQNLKKVFAGFMDNDASLFGRKFFKKNLLESSVDFAQKSRYAYGYDSRIVNYNPPKKDILIGYNNLGAKVSLASLTLDSTNLSYDFDLAYNFFYNSKNMFQHNAGLTGKMAKSYKGFYVGSGLKYTYFSLSDFLAIDPKYIASVSPFVKKSREQWSFKLGFEALLDKNMTETAEFHIYPDIEFEFSVVPSYINFFAGLSGKMEENDPMKIIKENPFILPDGSLFALPNTDHALVVSGGLKGNTGIGGNYLFSASYSLINDMLFFTNQISPLTLRPEVGNHFINLSDDVELLTIHGEISGKINDKISYSGSANGYKYTLTNNKYAFNKPSWEAIIGVKYNLRDKIIAGAEFTGIGKRDITVMDLNPFNSPASDYINMPAHFNLNLSAEYRYSKILSFWTKFNNIAYNRNYEWAYYPSQRFLVMLGFTYSL
jgi:hypothetical protein